MRRIEQLALVLAAASVFIAPPAIAADIAVPLDQVRMVAFDKPAATVYVGNPAVADVTVIDSKRVFVLGKAFGSTNIVALDGAGNQISDMALTVYGSGANMVTLNRGANQLTYACAASRCETAPLPGDASGPFQSVMGEVSQHQDMGKKAAEGSTNQ